MKKFIRIQSKQNIRVTAGLQSINMTNPNAPTPDKLNVKAAWSGTMVLLKEGVGYYPSVIKTWPTVESLAQKELITIGAETDSVDDPELAKNAEEMYKRIVLRNRQYEQVAKESERPIENAAVKETLKTPSF